MNDIEVGLKNSKIKVGRINGNFFVLSYNSRDNEREEHLWNCQCLLCGKDVIICTYSLKRNKSCGCAKSINYKRMIQKGKDRGINSAFKKAYKRYVVDNTKRGYTKLLSYEDFRTIVVKPCIYCNKAYSKICKSTYAILNYNTIDRIDSNIEYTLDNVVPCCLTCNIAKYYWEVNDFLYHVRLVNANLNRKIYDPDFYCI